MDACARYTTPCVHARNRIEYRVVMQFCTRQCRVAHMSVPVPPLRAEGGEPARGAEGTARGSGAGNYDRRERIPKAAWRRVAVTPPGRPVHGRPGGVPTPYMIAAWACALFRTPLRCGILLH